MTFCGPVMRATCDQSGMIDLGAYEGKTCFLNGEKRVLST